MPESTIVLTNERKDLSIQRCIDDKQVKMVAKCNKRVEDEITGEDLRVEKWKCGEVKPVKVYETKQSRQIALQQEEKWLYIVIRYDKLKDEDT